MDIMRRYLRCLLCLKKAKDTVVPSEATILAPSSITLEHNDSSRPVSNVITTTLDNTKSPTIRYQSATNPPLAEYVFPRTLRLESM